LFALSRVEDGLLHHRRQSCRLRGVRLMGAAARWRDERDGCGVGFLDCWQGQSFRLCPTAGLDVGAAQLEALDHV
jgi:hypothetical protein